MPVYDTGSPVQVPVSPDCLGHLLNISGESLDDDPPLPQHNYRHIHAQPVSLSEAVGMSDVLETGIKVINLLCPFLVGKKKVEHRSARPDITNGSLLLIGKTFTLYIETMSL